MGGSGALISFEENIWKGIAAGDYVFIGRNVVSPTTYITMNPIQIIALALAAAVLQGIARTK
ncbi:MAG: hypothetical protein WCO94_13320 [Verrucomicrobiota bacterium]